MGRHTEDQIKRYLSVLGQAVQVLARLVEIAAEITKVHW